MLLRVRLILVEFDIDITLTDRGIDVYIDKDSIIEELTYKLLNISVFPFLGRQTRLCSRILSSLMV